MKKRGIISEYLPWVIIAVVILAVLVISIYFLRQGGSGLIEKLKLLFRGR